MNYLFAEHIRSEKMKWQLTSNRRKNYEKIIIYDDNAGNGVISRFQH